MKGYGMKVVTLGVALIGIMLGGCSSMGAMNPMKWWGSGPEEQPVQRQAGTTVYQCAGGKQLVVRYVGEGQRQAMVLFPEREFRLDLAASGADVRYSNGRTTLLIKGDEVQLEEGGNMLYSNCKRAA
jgi:membrane-bound inhibitor of C-type lysozyme